MAACAQWGLGVAIELPLKYTIGCLGVLVGAVCLEVVLHLAAAIELIGGSQIATFHLLKDGAGINQTTLREVKVDTGAQEFLGQHGNIEEVGVETSYIAALEHLFQFLGQLLEGWLILQVLV